MWIVELSACYAKEGVMKEKDFEYDLISQISP